METSNSKQKVSLTVLKTNERSESFPRLNWEIPQRLIKAGITEAQVFETIERIAREHSNNIFGYLTKQDLKSEIWIICLEAISEFIPPKRNTFKRLEHFLRPTVRNRLINRFKDITKSVRSPCPRCPFYDPGHSAGDCSKFFLQKQECRKWRNYQMSVASRNSLLNATESDVEVVHELSPIKKAAAKEISDILRKALVGVLLRDFEAFMTGTKLSKPRMRKLQKAMKEAVVSVGMSLDNPMEH